MIVLAVGELTATQLGGGQGEWMEGECSWYWPARLGGLCRNGGRKSVGQISFREGG